MMREHFEAETDPQQTINTFLGAFGLLALGAGLMYLNDPDRGRRRRSMIRGKMTRAWNETSTGLRKTAQYTAGSTRGLMHEARGLFSPEQEVDDRKLAARIRSMMGRVVTHPRAIDILVSNGNVIVSGPILAAEEHDLLKSIASTRGVRDIVNQLEAHRSPGDIPALQGIGNRAALRRGLKQEYWPPTTRLAASVVGASLGLYGLAHRGATGTLMFLGGGLLMARGLTNLPARRIVGIGAGRRAVDVQKTINIDAPIEAVFNFFASYESFPHFMRNVKEVSDRGNCRSHWVVAGPAGMNVEWDAELTRFIPDELIAWKTVEGSMVENAGLIRFQQNPDGGTRVDIRLSYNPPAGAIGHSIAMLFGADPKSEMDQDLLRIKTTFESGRPPHDAAQPLEKA
jgi:uncharacterized membrane protein